MSTYTVTIFNSSAGLSPILISAHHPEDTRERERERIEGASSTCYTPTHCSWCWENVLYFSKEIWKPVMEHSTCPLLSEIPVKQSGQWSTKLLVISCRLTERSLVLVPHHSGRQDCLDTSHEYCTDTHSWIVQMAEREREREREREMISVSVQWRVLLPLYWALW